jgi:hypothetical protein
MLCTPQQTLSGDKINKSEMGSACSTYGEGRGKVHRPAGFGGET